MLERSLRAPRHADRGVLRRRSIHAGDGSVHLRGTSARMQMVRRHRQADDCRAYTDRSNVRVVKQNRMSRMPRAELARAARTRKNRPITFRATLVFSVEVVDDDGKLARWARAQGITFQTRT